ncbi:MAG: hypothetical protein VW835_00620 [Rickettsiales bacterium]
MRTRNPRTHQRRAVACREAEHHLDDARARLAVQIARRLVRKQEMRFAGERACQRDPLLLAARQLPRIVQQTLPQADFRQCLRGPDEGIGPAGQFHRHRDILLRRHGRDQMEGLTHHADFVAPEDRQRVLIEARDLAAGDLDAARRDTLQSRDHHDHRRLAGTRRADHADRFAAPDGKIDPSQDVDLAGIALKCKLHAVEPDHRFS